MTTASMELTSTAEMARATVESTATTDMTTAEMRAAAPATAHMNPAAMSSTTMSAAAARARVGRDGQSCQEGRRYDRDFEKVSHGFTPRI